MTRPGGQPPDTFHFLACGLRLRTSRDIPRQTCAWKALSQGKTDPGEYRIPDICSLEIPDRFDAVFNSKSLVNLTGKKSAGFIHSLWERSTQEGTMTDLPHNSIMSIHHDTRTFRGFKRRSISVTYKHWWCLFIQSSLYGLHGSKQ